MQLAETSNDPAVAVLLALAGKVLVRGRLRRGSPVNLVTNLQSMIFGALIVFFLIVEPLARLWAVHVAVPDPAFACPTARGDLCDIDALRICPEIIESTFERAKCGSTAEHSHYMLRW